MEPIVEQILNYSDGPRSRIPSALMTQLSGIVRLGRHSKTIRVLPFLRCVYVDLWIIRHMRILPYEMRDGTPVAQIAVHSSVRVATIV